VKKVLFRGASTTNARQGINYEKRAAVSREPTKTPAQLYRIKRYCSKIVKIDGGSKIKVYGLEAVLSSIKY
jgi:hypothetical protein